MQNPIVNALTMPSRRSASTPAAMSAEIPAHVVRSAWGMCPKASPRVLVPAVRPK